MNRLRALEGRFQGVEAASYENKRALIAIKNAYVTAGLNALQDIRERLEADLDDQEWQSVPDDREIESIRHNLRLLKVLERGLRSNIKDSGIMGIRHPAAMAEQFERMKKLSGKTGWHTGRDFRC